MDKATDDQETPLHRAADNGHAEVVAALLAAGATKDLKDKWGDTPLANAAENGHAEVVAALLAAGAAVKGSEAALLDARLDGHAEVVTMLRDAGASWFRGGIGWLADNLAAAALGCVCCAPCCFGGFGLAVDAVSCCRRIVCCRRRVVSTQAATGADFALKNRRS